MRKTDLPDVTPAATDVRRPADAHAGTELSRRLAALAAGHPSSPGYGDGRVRLASRPESRSGETVDSVASGGHLTDAHFAERIADVRALLGDAKKAGLTTDRQYTTDDRQKVWAPERVALQEQIVNDLYAQAFAVPCDGKAILAGGLPGAGKTTVLTKQAGIDLSQYVMINPDDIKEVMARRGLVPELGGLSPMEASELVHEESSLIAKHLAQRAYADGRNVIWDITMSSPRSTQRRIADLRAAGYGHIEGVFVEIPIEVSVRRADARHREGYAQYLAGNGLGGRYISPEVIRSQADPDYGSTNRRTFEQVKPGLDYWRRYDNSADGRPATLAEASGPRHHERREAAR